MAMGTAYPIVQPTSILDLEGHQNHIVLIARHL